MSTEHNGHLQWVPGEDRPPLRNMSKNLLTRQELDENIAEAFDFHRERFRMWVPEEVEKYCEIRDRAANGWYQIIHLERTSVQQPNGETEQIIFIEWLQVYGEEINGKRPPQNHQPPGADDVLLDNTYARQNIFA